MQFNIDLGNSKKHCKCTYNLQRRHKIFINVKYYFLNNLKYPRAYIVQCPLKFLKIKFTGISHNIFKTVKTQTVNYKSLKMLIDLFREISTVGINMYTLLFQIFYCN